MGNDDSQPEDERDSFICEEGDGHHEWKPWMRFVSVDPCRQPSLNDTLTSLPICWLRRGPANSLEDIQVDSPDHEILLPILIPLASPDPVPNLESLLSLIPSDLESLREENKVPPAES